MWIVYLDGERCDLKLVTNNTMRLASVMKVEFPKDVVLPSWGFYISVP